MVFFIKTSRHILTTSVLLYKPSLHINTLHFTKYTFNLDFFFFLPNVSSALVSAILHENKYFYKESYCLFTEIYELQETTKI